MKRIIALIILMLTIQYSFGQACGVYRIKYVGNIESKSLKVEKIKLPTIEYLHGLEGESSEKGYVEIDLESNGIEIQLGSHLTSHLYDKPESLLKLYMEKRENIPIIITAIENGISREIEMEINWSDIQITKLEDENFGNFFKLDLKRINL